MLGWETVPASHDRFHSPADVTPEVSETPLPPDPFSSGLPPQPPEPQSNADSLNPFPLLPVIPPILPLPPTPTPPAAQPTPAPTPAPQKPLARAQPVNRDKPLARAFPVASRRTTTPEPTQPTEPTEPTERTESSDPADIPLAHRTPKRKKAANPPAFGPIHPLLLTLVAYACMMAVSFGQSTFALLDLTEPSTLTDAQTRRQLAYDSMVFEGLDTLIVLSALVLIGRPVAQNAAAHRLLTWLCSVPLLPIVLGINLGYHYALKSLVRPDKTDIEEVIDLSLKDGWWSIVLICVQPAVVEELFFRYILLGHLRSHLGLHASVWLTAILFGMAHLGNIGGWPVLILVGAALGYARVLSGGLTLPIILHFCHNYAVLFIDDAMKHG